MPQRMRGRDFSEASPLSVVQGNQLVGRHGRHPIEFFEIDPLPVAAALVRALLRALLVRIRRVASAISLDGPQCQRLAANEQLTPPPPF
jgi:hypothetical protein